MKNFSLIWLSLAILIHTTKANLTEAEIFKVFYDYDQRSKDSLFELPIDLVNKLNEVENYEDILAEYITNKDEYLADLSQPRMSFGLRSGGADPDVVHVRVKFTPLAKCELRDEVISLTTNFTNASLRYIPSCVAVKRCSGCCNTDSRLCQPTEVAMKTIQIIKVGDNKKVDNKTKVDYRGREFVEVEEHFKCDCLCKRKAECNLKQVFNEKACSCDCRKNESNECEKRGRVWNNDNCTCDCEKNEECSSGQYFNNETCECSNEEK